MKPRTPGEQKAFLDGFAQAVLSIHNGSIEQSALWIVQQAHSQRHATAAIARIARELGVGEVES